MIVNTILIFFLAATAIFNCNKNQIESTSNQLINPVEVNSRRNTTTGSSFKREIVAVSTDKGLTWKPLNTGLPENTQATLLESKGNELLLATDNQGIFISENNKSKWRNIGRDLPSAKINALFVAGDDIYAGVYKHGIYNSSSNGNSWISLNERLPNLNVQAILKLNENLIVGTDIGIYKTQNG
jgi:hypothetical protein